MAKNPPFRRDRKPPMSQPVNQPVSQPESQPVPEIVEAAAAAAAPNAADAMLAAPQADAPAPEPAAEPGEQIAAAATEPAFAMTPAVTPLAVVENIAQAVTPATLGAGTMPAIAPRMPATLAQAGQAYLHAWLDCQREAAQFLDRQLEFGRRAQRRLSECADVAAVARIQRDWSAEALKACLDEAACLPVFAARFWTIGLAQLAAQGKPAAGAPTP